MKDRKGFTLIEFIIYIGLVAIVLVSAGAITLNVIYGKVKLKSIEEVNYGARMAMIKITESIKNAQAINSPLWGENSSSLSLQMSNDSLDPIIFDLSEGVLRIKKGDGSFVDITSDEVNVSDLQFFNLSQNDAPGTIRVKMTIEFDNPNNRQEYSFQNTFYTTVNIRKK